MISSITQELDQSTSRPFHQHIAIILALSAIFFICRFEFFLPVTADDLFFGYFDEPLTALALANEVNGRFASGFLVRIFSHTNLYYMYFLYACKLLTIIFYALFSYTFFCLICKRYSLTLSLIFAFIILLHPYSTTNFDNIINQPNMVVSILFLLFNIWAFHLFRGIFSVVICSLCLLVVAASYQTNGYFFVIFVIGHTLFRCESPLQALANLARGATAVAVSLLAYFVSHNILVPIALEQVASFPDPLLATMFLDDRSGTNSLTEIPSAILNYLDQIIRALAVPEPIFGTVQKLIVGEILFLPIAYWFVRTLASGKQVLMRSLLPICLLLLLVILSGSPIHILLSQAATPPEIYCPHISSNCCHLVVWPPETTR